MRLRILEQAGNAPLKDRGVHELGMRPLKGELLTWQEAPDGPRNVYRVLDVVHNLAHPDGQTCPDQVQMVVARVMTECQLAQHVAQALCNSQRERQSALFS